MKSSRIGEKPASPKLPESSDSGQLCMESVEFTAERGERRLSLPPSSLGRRYSSVASGRDFLARNSCVFEGESHFLALPLHSLSIHGS